MSTVTNTRRLSLNACTMMWFFPSLFRPLWRLDWVMSDKMRRGIGILRSVFHNGEAAEDLLAILRTRRQETPVEVFIPIGDKLRGTWTSDGDRAPKRLSRGAAARSARHCSLQRALARVWLIQRPRYNRAQYRERAARKSGTRTRARARGVKRIALEIGNAFDRLVMRPGYRRVSVKHGVAGTHGIFRHNGRNKYKYLTMRRIFQRGVFVRMSVFKHRWGARRCASVNLRWYL